MKQERAARTRNALLKAAASEFARSGYDGASLSRICGSAGISMGALTFHFPTKGDLARAVEEQGRNTTLLTLERAGSRQLPALDALVEMAVELSRLMAEDVSVGSAVRLGRERPGAIPWSSLWLPDVREVVRRAHEQGHLGSRAEPADVTALVECLVSGTEILLRRPPSEADGTAEERKADEERAAAVLRRIERVWRLVLDGVSASPSGSGVPGPGP